MLILASERILRKRSELKDSAQIHRLIIRFEGGCAYPAFETMGRVRPYSTIIALISLTLVSVGPVSTRSPLAAK